MTKHDRLPRPALPRDSLVGHFQVLRLLGRGGCGEVYLARDQRLGRKVALKVVHPQLLGSEEAVERFVFEARATARFNHPHIVTVYEVGEHRGMPYVALEYLEGRTLRQLLREQRPTVKEAARIALAIAEALVAAHAEGILHRDLKPENIFLPKDGRLRVLDFGLAKHMGADGRTSSLDSTGGVSDPIAELAIGLSSLGPTGRAGREGHEGHAGHEGHDTVEGDAFGDTDEASASDVAQREAALDATAATRGAVPRALRPREAAPASIFDASSPSPGATLSGFDSDAHPAARGTPYYMAPEQWRSAESSPATDAWALGVILWELFAGELPLDLHDRKALRERVLDDAPMPFLPQALELPGELSALVERCLRKPAAGRPAAEDIAAALRAVLAPAAVDLEEEQGPFRGLLPFAERHAALYFGRQGEIAGFLERLRLEPILAVVGPSGAGKSSFVQAGVVPRLREQAPWQVLRVRPGPRPFRSLAARLRSTADSSLGSVPSVLRSGSTSGEAVGDEGEERLAQELEQAPGRLGLLLRQRAEEPGGRLLLIVDQLEELYTLGDDPIASERFMQALAQAADDPDEPLRVIVTLREDFLGRVAAGPAARQVLGRVLVLRSPDGDALAEILRRAPQAFGYRYEDPALVDEMVAAVGRDPACLPLLSFAGRMLWERRDRARRLLTRSAYRTLGGVEGALASHADAVIDGLLAEQHDSARRLLLRLVTADDTRAVVEGRELLAALPDDTHTVLDRLVEARLVTSRRGKGEAGLGSYELAHEALIRSWHRLRQWLEESREERAFLAELSQAAALWDRRGRRDAEVWQGEALAEARSGAQRLGVALPSEVDAFLEAGFRAETLRARASARRRRVLRLGIAGAALGVFALLLAWGLTLRSKERQARVSGERAVEQLAVSERERAALAFDQGAMLAARSLLRASLERADSDAARFTWLRLEYEPQTWAFVYPHSLRGFGVSPDGRRVAMSFVDDSYALLDTRSSARLKLAFDTKDPPGWVLPLLDGRLAVSSLGRKHVELRSLDGRSREVLAPPPAAYMHLVASPDGRWLYGIGGEVVRWDLRNPKRPPVPLPALRGVRGLRFVDKTLVVASGFPQVALYRDGKRFSEKFVSPPGMLYGAVAIAPDGRRAALIEGMPGRAVRVVDLRGKILLRLPAPDLAQAVAFDNSGTLLAVATRDSSIDLWDASSGRFLRRLSVARGNRFRRWVTHLHFLPGDRGLLAATPSGALVRFDLSKVRVLAPGGHAASIHGLTFTPDEHLLSIDADGWLRRWNRGGQPRQAVLAHRGVALALALVAGGAKVATAGGDGTVRLWDARSLQLVREFAGHRGAVLALVAGQDGKTLYSAGEDKTVRRWDLEAARVAGAVLSLPEAAVLALGPTGNELFVGGRVFSWLRRYRTPNLEYLDATRLRGGGLAMISARASRLAVRQGGVVNIFDRPADQPLATARLVAARIVGLGSCQQMFAPLSGRVLLGARSDITGLTLLEAQTLASVGGVTAGHGSTITDCRFDARERTLATSSSAGTLRLWDGHTLLPRAHASLLLPAPPRLYEQRGVRDLRSGKIRPPRRAWERRLLLARRAAADQDQRLLCLQTFARDVELWDLRTDQRRLRVASAPLAAALGVTTGATPSCVVRTDSHLVRYRERRKPTTIPDVLTFTTRGEELLVLARGKPLMRCDADDRCQVVAELPHQTVIYAVPGGLVVGDLGRTSLVLEGRERTPERWSTLYAGQGVANTAVLRGPRDLLVLGYVNGRTELSWLPRREHALALQLHGPILGMVLDGHELYVASELGDYRRVDLSTLFLPHCALLRRVWAAAPALWDGSRAVPTPPPQHHPCR